jgi:hypothetical protein
MTPFSYLGQPFNLFILLKYDRHKNWLYAETRRLCKCFLSRIVEITVGLRNYSGFWSQSQRYQGTKRLQTTCQRAEIWGRSLIAQRQIRTYHMGNLLVGQQERVEAKMAVLVQSGRGIITSIIMVLKVYSGAMKRDDYKVVMKVQTRVFPGAIITLASYSATSTMIFLTLLGIMDLTLMGIEVRPLRSEQTHDWLLFIYFCECSYLNV